MSFCATRDGEHERKDLFLEPTWLGALLGPADGVGSGKWGLGNWERGKGVFEHACVSSFSSRAFRFICL